MVALSSFSILCVFLYRYLILCLCICKILIMSSFDVIKDDDDYNMHFVLKSLDFCHQTGHT